MNTCEYLEHKNPSQRYPELFALQLVLTVVALAILPFIVLLAVLRALESFGREVWALWDTEAWNLF